MSFPQFSRQLTSAINNYEERMSFWEQSRADKTVRWRDLADVGANVAKARKRLVLAIKAEFRAHQQQPMTTVECLAWYDHLVNDRRPLILAEDK